MNKFAERLKELRIEKGLSQAQLAKATGISVRAIGMWEGKQRTPNIEAIILLAKFFEVTSDYLIGMSDY
ncbi:MAG: helix-turn-helix transcriptional regulator [Clostridia bacterium]|nr:helix-turn-helix transcriptional regulator [Clostridia bacterium]